MKDFAFTLSALFLISVGGICGANSTDIRVGRQSADTSQYVSVPEQGVTAYVARRNFENGDQIVGKYVHQWKLIYIPYHGKETAYPDNIELLKSNGKHAWTAYLGSVPSNAIQGGKEGTAKLYVGRKFHEGKFLIGKIVEGINAIFCPYFEKELRFDNDFEILVENPN